MSSGMTRILVVDDKPENLYLLRALFSAKGYDVIEATNGKEALTLAHQAPPDLIIADILMPVMDGFALCKEWKADAQLHAIPFIFYTATYTEPKDKEFALSLGAELFLIKPQEPQVLLSEIAQVLTLSKINERPVVSESEENNIDFYRQYNVRLIRKLEDKLTEIEQKNSQLAAKEKALRLANEQLEQRVVERTAELTRVNQELVAFNYSVSHDLRAPLFHVNGFTQVVLDEYQDQLGAEGQDYLQRVCKATDNMSAMIDSLLELSQLTHAELTRQPVDLTGLAEATIAHLTDRKPDRKVDFVIQDNVTAFGDHRLLTVLIDNLLGNAWKYTAKKTQAHIEFGATHQDGELLYFVKDNGDGFDMQYVDRLFAPFQRLHGKEFEGIGIGLATVRRVINRHSGKVWAQGKPGEGATFFFTLPSDRKIDDN